ncbi:hypothetical protein [Pararhodospirillum photometricum]|nr:hypothetical protein [Pararhodospirillum photometricum]
MTEPSALDHVKLVGKTVAAVLGGLGVMAYLVRLLQYRLHGLPFDGEVSVETYLLAVGLLLTIGQSAVLVVGPLLAVAWGGRLVRARIFPGGATGGRRFLAWLTLGAVVLLTLLLPAGQIGSTPPIWGAASAPAVASLLVREDGAWLVVSGLAVGGLGLALVPLGRLLLQARLRIPSWPRVVACAALATVALSFFLPIIAATLPAPGGTLPRGSVHLRAPADGWVAGYLLPLSGQDLLVLPASPDVQEVEILPRENIGRIVFFAGGGKSMNDLMKERWKGEKKPLRIGGMPFGGWGALSAVVLTLGFVFAGGSAGRRAPGAPRRGGSAALGAGVLPPGERGRE